MASDRFTAGISYYASMKAQKHSADIQAAQAAQSNSGGMYNRLL